MTEPRDIEKDKDYLKHLTELAGRFTSMHSSRAIAIYYVDQYEAQQARITELEEERDIYSKAVLTYSDMIITDSEDHPQDVGEVARNALEEISLIRLRRKVDA